MLFFIDPLPKPRMTVGDKANYRPVTQRYWAYKDELVNQANQAGFVLPDSFIAIFYLPMPASWSKKKRAEMRGKPHQQKPDKSNLMKAIEDCLKPVDDATIWLDMSAKIWADEGAIRIEPIANPEQEFNRLIAEIREVIVRTK